MSAAHMDSPLCFSSTSCGIPKSPLQEDHASVFILDGRSLNGLEASLLVQGFSNSFIPHNDMIGSTTLAVS
jgi:hypothetical protein